MKDLIIIIIILILVFGGDFCIHQYIDKTESEIIDLLETMGQGIETHSETLKKEYVSELNNIWNEKQKVWVMIQYHESIASAQEKIIECSNYYKSGNKVEFDSSFEKLKIDLEKLKNQETLTLDNIL